MSAGYSLDAHDLFNTRALGKLMAEPNLTVFSVYHYGALRGYGEMAKSLISEDMPLAERLKSIDRLAMLGLVTFVVYPQLDKLAKLLTGDKSAEFRRAGASTFIWNLAKLARGEKTPTEVLESVVTPAPHTKAALQLALNRDFYNGRKIYEPSAPAGNIAKQVGRYAADAISPIQQGSRVLQGKQTAKEFAASLVGIRTKVKSPAESLALRLLLDRMPQGAGNEAQRQTSLLARTYEQQIRDGSMRSQELGKAVKRGEITEQQAVRIFTNSKSSPLVLDFRRLPIEDALRVWDRATDDERKALRPALVQKATNFKAENYTPERRRELIGKIRAALMPKPQGVPMRPPGFAGFKVQMSAPR